MLTDTNRLFVSPRGAVKSGSDGSSDILTNGYGDDRSLIAYGGCTLCTGFCSGGCSVSAFQGERLSAHHMPTRQIEDILGCFLSNNAQNEDTIRRKEKTDHHSTYMQISKSEYCQSGCDTKRESHQEPAVKKLD